MLQNCYRDFPISVLFLKQRAIFFTRSLSFVSIILSALLILILRISEVSIIKWNALDLVIRVRYKERTGDLDLILPLQGELGDLRRLFHPSRPTCIRK